MRRPLVGRLVAEWAAAEVDRDDHAGAVDADRRQKHPRHALPRRACVRVCVCACVRVCVRVILCV